MTPGVARGGDGNGDFMYSEQDLSKRLEVFSRDVKNEVRQMVTEIVDKSKKTFEDKFSNIITDL